jgi:hypothetical protein
MESAGVEAGAKMFVGLDITDCAKEELTNRRTDESTCNVSRRFAGFSAP